MLSVKFGSGSLFVTENFWRHHHNHHRHHRYYIIITISILIIFSSPPLKSLAFHHLCSPHQCDTGGWPAWGYAHRRHISSGYFSEGEKRRPEMRLLFAGQLGVTRTDFNIRHCVFSPNWSLPLSWFTVGFKSPSPLNLQHFVQRLSYNFLRLV